MREVKIDFAALISPMRKEEFFADFWQKQPLVQSINTPGRFAGLLSLEDIDFLVSCLRPSDVSSLRLIREGKALPAIAYTRSDGSVDLASVYRAYNKGHTLLLTNLEQRWKSIGWLCRNLEAVFTLSGVALRKKVAANLYLTPASSHGFPAHYDNHDTLIVQLEGRKNWRIYDPLESFPVELQSTPPAPEDLPRLQKEFTVGPGSVFYIPRGFYHEAATLEEHSLHLTIGLYPATWIDLLGRLAASDARCREALPAVSEEFTGQLRVRIESLQQRDDVEKLRLALLHEFADNLGIAVDDGFIQLNAYKAVELDTLVSKRDGSLVRLDKKADELRLLFSGGGFAGAEQLEPVFRFIIETDVFCPQRSARCTL